MRSHNSVSVLADAKTRSCVCSFFITMSLISGAYLIGSAWIQNNSVTTLSAGRGLNIEHSLKCEVSPIVDAGTSDQAHLEKCTAHWYRIVAKRNYFHYFKLGNVPSVWPCFRGSHELRDTHQHISKLVSIEFLGEEFAVMLFHYDGVVDEWHDLEWSHRVIHISATNQTKWWFAKRFLHPDIVAEYEYIFLWDEDLGLDNFHPARYMSIIKEEGFEISQPALDPAKSQVHHQITMRNRRSRVHRRYYRLKDGGSGRCDGNSTAPPCVGWVEMMAPVFSRAAWRCVWHMIQNDLIHAWGLDKQLGYCAQGDRTIKVGVVDEEYVVHLGLPTLGGLSDKDKKSAESSDQSPSSSHSESVVGPGLDKLNNRSAARLRSYAEMRTFWKRWNKAVEEDECWVDPFAQPSH